MFISSSEHLLQSWLTLDLIVPTQYLHALTKPPPTQFLHVLTEPQHNHICLTIFKLLCTFWHKILVLPSCFSSYCATELQLRRTSTKPTYKRQSSWLQGYFLKRSSFFYISVSSTLSPHVVPSLRVQSDIHSTTSRQIGNDKTVSFQCWEWLGSQELIRILD